MRSGADVDIRGEFERATTKPQTRHQKLKTLRKRQKQRRDRKKAQEK